MVTVTPVRTSEGDLEAEVEITVKGLSFRLNLLELDSLGKAIVVGKKILQEAERQAFLKKNLSLFNN